MDTIGAIPTSMVSNLRPDARSMTNSILISSETSRRHLDQEERSLTHSPHAVIHSPAAMVAAWRRGDALHWAGLRAYLKPCGYRGSSRASTGSREESLTGECYVPKHPHTVQFRAPGHGRRNSCVGPAIRS